MPGLTLLPDAGWEILESLRKRLPQRPANAVAEEDERALTALIESLAALVEAGLEPARALDRIATASRRRSAQERSVGRKVSERPETEAFLQTAARAAAAERLGESPAEILLAGARGVRSPRMARIYAELSLCFRLSEEHGIPLARLLRVQAEVCRERLDAEAELRAALAGPESTAQMLLWLPAVGAGLGLLLIGGEWIRALLSPAGLGLAILGGLLTVLGRRWTARVLTRARQVSVEC